MAREDIRPAPPRLKLAAAPAEPNPMGSDRRAILFCPPLAPVELESDSRVAIGRGRDCELPLFSDSASRRHA